MDVYRRSEFCSKHISEDILVSHYHGSLQLPPRVSPNPEELALSLWLFMVDSRLGHKYPKFALIRMLLKVSRGGYRYLKFIIFYKASTYGYLFKIPGYRYKYFVSINEYLNDTFYTTLMTFSMFLTSLLSVITG